MAALVTGLLGCLSVVGLVLGIVALFRIRRTGENGRNLAIGGIVAFAAWTALFVALLALGRLSFSASMGADRQSGAPLSIPGAAPPSVHVGQCLDLQGDELSARSVVLPCDSPHDGQILHIYNAPPGPYPGDRAFIAQAEDVCRRAKAKLRTPLPPPPPRLTLGFNRSTKVAWAAGYRQVLCYVQAREGKVNGSLLKD
ncbi:DUF4190 domain-containing protein [Actinomadura syzygii]|uniref:DUF4190 domain-containing protein n=1 Tax=Actinomadura syzygii TaxID=1427538 RepID=UPI00248318D1|nr:DUF4190 domain-containing protein [Actinomadura syzygii]